MKTVCAILSFLLLLGYSSFAQDQPDWDEVKGRKIIRELDQVLLNCSKVTQNTLGTDSAFARDVDSIEQQITKFKMEVRRRSRYASQFRNDYSWYNNLLAYAYTTKSKDTLLGIIKDIKDDLFLKTMNPVLIDSGQGPVGGAIAAKPVHLKVSVYCDTIPSPLNGFEVYIKTGTFIPSSDSTRLPQLTDNAAMKVFPGLFTIVAWKGKQYASATLKVLRDQPNLICDIKLK